MAIVNFRLIWNEKAIHEMFSRPGLAEEIGLMCAAEMRANIDLGGRDESGSTGVFIPSQRVLGYPKKVAALKERLERAKKKGNKNINKIESKISSEIAELQKDIGGITGIDSGDMIRSITHEVRDNEILVGTNIDSGGQGVPYPYYFNFGKSGKYPARVFVMLPTPTFDEILATAFSDIDFERVA